MIRDFHVCFLAPDCWRERIRWGLDMPTARISWKRGRTCFEIALLPAHKVQKYDWKQHRWVDKWVWANAFPAAI